MKPHGGSKGARAGPAWMGSRGRTWRAPGTEKEQRTCRAVQRTAFDKVPFYPIGQHKQPTAYRDRITGVLSGAATFWNVRPA